jgi:hypothetical protein
MGASADSFKPRGARCCEPERRGVEPPSGRARVDLARGRLAPADGGKGQVASGPDEFALDCFSRFRFDLIRSTRGASHTIDGPLATVVYPKRGAARAVAEQVGGVVGGFERNEADSRSGGLKTTLGSPVSQSRYRAVEPACLRCGAGRRGGGAESWQGRPAWRADRTRCGGPAPDRGPAAERAGTSSVPVACPVMAEIHVGCVLDRDTAVRAGLPLLEGALAAGLRL